MRTPTATIFTIHAIPEEVIALTYEALDLLLALIRSLLSHIHEIKMTRKYRQIRTLNIKLLIGLSNFPYTSN